MNDEEEKQLSLQVVEADTRQESNSYWNSAAVSI